MMNAKEELHATAPTLELGNPAEKGDLSETPRPAGRVSARSQRAIIRRLERSFFRRVLRQAVWRARILAACFRSIRAIHTFAPHKPARDPQD